MITSNIENFSSMTTVKAKVDIYEGDTLAVTCTCGEGEGIGAGALENFTLSREGEMGKFFGFGVCHKLDLNLIDFDRQLTIKQNNTIDIGLGDGTLWDSPYPTLYITEVTRDEKTDSIRVAAFDILYKANEHSVAELPLAASYSLHDFATAIATYLGVELSVDVHAYDAFTTYYDGGANLDGSEKLRDILNAIAEATQTIYFINYQNKLKFKRLRSTTNSGNMLAPVAWFYKDNYYELTTQPACKLTGVCSATELGDNIEANNGEEGVTQYVRDNPFWVLRSDLPELVEAALATMGGLEITPFYADWSGDYRLEIGDRINTQSGAELSASTAAFVLNDRIEYIGTLNEVTEWSYTDNSSESPSNPTNIGDKINQTVAMVDKVNQEISLVVVDVTSNSESISQLQLDTTGIQASVSQIEQYTKETADTLSETVETLSKEVNLAVTEDEVSILVQRTLQEGVEKVVTSAKKYSFDDTGLNVISTDSNISTTITEDGMRISRAGEEVLTADNEGVKAEDLHATTYLIIGNNSRLEDWETESGKRTACFWIGG